MHVGSKRLVYLTTTLTEISFWGLDPLFGCHVNMSLSLTRSSDFSLVPPLTSKQAPKSERLQKTTHRVGPWFERPFGLPFWVHVNVDPFNTGIDCEAIDG